MKINIKDEIAEKMIEKIVEKEMDKTMEKWIEGKKSPDIITSSHADDINLNRINTGQLLITMNTPERPFFDNIADIDRDIPGYDRIRIFDTCERISPRLSLINDGPDIIYAILCRDGHIKNKGDESWSESEILIYPGEKWTFFDVYELRVRSPTQGNKYRVTEDDISTHRKRFV